MPRIPYLAESSESNQTENAHEPPEVPQTTCLQVLHDTIARASCKRSSKTLKTVPILQPTGPPFRSLFGSPLTEPSSSKQEPGPLRSPGSSLHSSADFWRRLVPSILRSGLFQTLCDSENLLLLLPMSFRFNGPTVSTHVDKALQSNQKNLRKPCRLHQFRVPARKHGFLGGQNSKKSWHTPAGIHYGAPRMATPQEPFFQTISSPVSCERPCQSFTCQTYGAVASRASLRKTSPLCCMSYYMRSAPNSGKREKKQLCKSLLLRPCSFCGTVCHWYDPTNGSFRRSGVRL